VKVKELFSFQLSETELFIMNNNSIIVAYVRRKIWFVLKSVCWCVYDTHDLC